MSLPWITVNKRLLEAVQIINTTPTDVYLDVLARVASLIGDKDAYSPERLAALEEATHGIGQTDVRLLVHGIVHVFSKSSQVIMKPDALRKALTDNLRMDGPKAEAFLKAWTDATKREFGDLDRRKKLDDVSWQLNLETNSASGGDAVVAKARLHLSLSDFCGGDAENVTLEMDERELVRLYETLEEVQGKLDAVRNKLS